MWKKMRRQAGGVDSVSDAVALRVVLKAKREPGETDHSFEVKSRQLCYHVRGSTESDGTKQSNSMVAQHRCSVAPQHKTSYVVLRRGPNLKRNVRAMTLA